MRRLLPAIAAAYFLSVAVATAGTFGAEVISAPKFTDPTLGVMKAATGALNKTSDTTLANIPGLAISLTAGATYVCRGHVYVAASNGTGGAKIGVGTSDTLTATTNRGFARAYTSSALAGIGNTGAFPAALVGLNSAIVDIDFNLEIIVNVGGTLTVQGAQNTSDPAQTTFAGIDSWLECEKIG